MGTTIDKHLRDIVLEWDINIEKDVYKLENLFTCHNHNNLNYISRALKFIYIF